jgi:hypothetical protein
MSCVRCSALASTQLDVNGQPSYATFAGMESAIGRKELPLVLKA